MNQSLEIYSNIEIESDVMAASSHRLIQLLLNTCVQSIDLARAGVTNKDFRKKQYGIKKASNVVTYLRECLNIDDDKSKALASLLDKTYEGVGRNLLQATLSDNIQHLNNAYEAMLNIKSGWDDIQNKVT